MANQPKATPRRAGARTRFFAFTALSSLVACVAYVGAEAYRAATDSFVAPIILSPDSDLVLASKLRASQLAAERALAASDLEALDETTAAGQQALVRLKNLQRTPGSASAFATRTNDRRVSAGHVEQKMLVEQRALLVEMAEKQAAIVDEARSNLAAGLISKLEVTKERKTQNDLALALLENDRTRLQTNVQLQQLVLTQKSLQGGDTPAMPEVTAREEQMVHLELEILRLESEQKSKRSERKLLTQKVTALDELDAQLKTRPLFRATEKTMEVAFVPYTQMNGVAAGATVYDCVWGVFHCRAVGVVTEVVPGEVVLPDPWGNQARGQYAVLGLRDHESAKAKTLRIRGATVAPAAPAPAPGDRVSAK